MEKKMQHDIGIWIIWDYIVACRGRVILKLLHDPKYLIPWEFWASSMIGSCRTFRINSRFEISGSGFWVEA